MDRQDGFSLIEVILVIVIMIVLAAVVSLGLPGLSTARLDNAVNKLVGDLRYAQQLAITTQSRHGLTVDSALFYSVHQHTLPDPPGTDVDIQDPTNLGNPFVVNFDTYQQGELNGVRFTSTTPFCGGTSIIEFDSFGAPTDTAGILLACVSTISLTRSGETRTLTVQPNTGQLTY